MTPPVLEYPDLDRPFVVETDESSTGAGEVLDQKKTDGYIHHIQYASREPD